MGVKPHVPVFPITACWVHVCTGLMVHEFGYHTLSNRNNSDYLGHEKNWLEDMIGHRIHKNTEELEWGKMGTRDSGNPGGKTNRQIYQETLCHSVCFTNSRERAFECPSLGHMLILCTEEPVLCDWQSPLGLYPLRGWKFSYQEKAGWTWASRNSRRSIQHCRKPLKRVTDSTW